MKILLKNGARDEGILDIVADNIKSGRLIQFKRIFQFLVKEVGLAVTQQMVDKVTEPGPAGDFSCAGYRYVLPQLRTPVLQAKSPSRDLLPTQDGGIINFDRCQY